MPALPHDDDFDGWVSMLAVPHVARRAYRHLVVRPAARDAATRGLQHEDGAVRAWCCKILDHLADETTFGLLAGMVRDPSPRARLEALHALACDRCKTDVCSPAKDEVLPLALDVLRHDEDKYVRAMAVEVVGRWSTTDDGAAAALVDAREHDAEPSVRKKAGWYAPGGTIYRKRAHAGR